MGLYANTITILKDSSLICIDTPHELYFLSSIIFLSLLDSYNIFINSLVASIKV